MTKRYGVWCEVFGGVTGFRHNWLKSNDEVCKFAEYEEAEEEARLLNMKMNGPNARAYFSYSARLLGN